LYVALCVAAPALWGTVMYFVFAAIDRRRRDRRDDEKPPIDYSI
jgi:hypothetical protein